jgi:hypothetical protein
VVQSVSRRLSNQTCLGKTLAATPPAWFLTELPAADCDMSVPRLKLTEMSLQALANEVIAELEQALELFGPTPRSADWDSAAQLASVRDGVATQQNHRAAWQGASGSACRGVALGAVARLGDVIAADAATADEIATAAATARDGRTAMTAIVDGAKRGVAAIAPSTETPAGKTELVAHLQRQLTRAQEVVGSAAQRDSTIAAAIRAAGADPVDRRTGATDTAIVTGRRGLGCPARRLPDTTATTPPRRRSSSARPALGVLLRSRPRPVVLRGIRRGHPWGVPV